MAIDPRIALGVQPMQIENPVNQLAKVLQIKDMQQGQQMNALKMDEYRRSVEDGNALRTELSQPGANPYDVLLKRGKVKEAGDFAQSQAAARNSEVGAKKLELEMGLKKAEHVSSILSQARDPQSYGVVRNVIKTQFGQDLPEQFDPAMVQAIIAQGQTLTQRLAAEHQRLTLAETGRHNQATEGLTARGQNITMRGQNLVDARSRESAEIQRNQPRGQFIETPNGYMLADPKTGAVRPVMGPDGQPLKGKAADRNLNETQAKANMFGTRMREADRILNELEDKGVTNPGLIKGAVEGAAGLTPFMGDKMSDAAGSVMNVLPGVLGGPNAQQQQVEQARRDFINAVLRKESGAVISPQEFANAERQYFPQPGNDKEVIQQKRALRKRATDLMLAEVPGGSRLPAADDTGKPNVTPPAAPTAFADPGKESRYQQWKRQQQGGK